MPGDGTERLIVVAEAVFAQISTDCHAKLAEAIRSSVTSEFGVGPDVHICPRRTIPTTTSGKVRRQEAKRLFLADAHTVGAGMSAESLSCPVRLATATCSPHDWPI